MLSLITLQFRAGQAEDGGQDGRATEWGKGHIEAGDTDLLMVHFDL